MRLYNAASCTPAATTAKTKRWLQPPQTFVPTTKVVAVTKQQRKVVVHTNAARTAQQQQLSPSPPRRDALYPSKHAYPLPLSLTASSSFSPPRSGPPSVVLFPTPPRRQQRGARGAEYNNNNNNKRINNNKTSSPQISKTTTGTTATGSSQDEDDEFDNSRRLSYSSGAFHFDIEPQRANVDADADVVDEHQLPYSWDDPDDISMDSSSTLSSWASFRQERNPDNVLARQNDEIRFDWQASPSHSPVIDDIDNNTIDYRQDVILAVPDDNGFAVVQRRGILPQAPPDATVMWPRTTLVKPPPTMTYCAASATVVSDDDWNLALFPTRQPHEPKQFAQPPRPVVATPMVVSVVDKKHHDNSKHHGAAGPWIDFYLPDNPFAPDSEFDLNGRSPFEPIEHPPEQPATTVVVASPRADRSRLATICSARVPPPTSHGMQSSHVKSKVETAVATPALLVPATSGPWKRRQPRAVVAVPFGRVVQKKPTAKCEAVQVAALPPCPSLEPRMARVEQHHLRTVRQDGVDSKRQLESIALSKVNRNDTLLVRINARHGSHGVVQTNQPEVLQNQPSGKALDVETRVSQSHAKTSQKGPSSCSATLKADKAAIPSQRRAPLLLGHLLEERYQAARRKEVLPRKPMAFASSNQAVASGNAERGQGNLERSLQDDPALSKYARMLKVGLPMSAVKNSMERDGIKCTQNLDGELSRSTPRDAASKLNAAPALAKYARMLKVGLPMSAVNNAMQRDGLDSSILDEREPGEMDTPAEALKDPYRRFRLHWETHSNVRSNTIWAMVSRDQEWLGEVLVDEEEIETLFRAEKNATAVVDVATGARPSGEAAVMVIDPKRANNGGIALARIKLSYGDMARAIDSCDVSALTLEQIKVILPFIPTAAEEEALDAFMAKGGQELKTECEKFMAEIMTVDQPKRKLDAMLFMKRFPIGVDELKNDARLIHKACVEVCGASRLRKVLGIVLHLGNLLNTTGGNTKGMAAALQLESLLKLDQAKAFDKKTSFLQYAARVVRRNSPALLQFKDELQTLTLAERVNWDQALGELENMEVSLNEIRRLALTLDNANIGSVGESSEAEESLSPDDEVRVLQSTSVGSFTLDANLRMGSVYGEIASSKRAFGALLNYFGEEERTDLGPQLFLHTLSQFCNNFDVAAEQAIASEKQRARETRSASVAPRTGGTDARSARNGDPATSMGHMVSAIQMRPTTE